jgi:hypothetical protein
MTQEPIQAEPVEVEYYQDSDFAVRLIRVVAIFGIAYGAYQLLLVGLVLTGAAMGFGWYANVGPGTSYLTLRFAGVIVGSVLTVVLVASGIGCISLRPRAWTGMLAYCIGAVGINLFWAGYYVVMSLRPAPPGMMWSGEWLLMLVGSLHGPLESSMFPLLALIVFRMRDVRRVFGK